jgi:hypothetical protein
MCVDVLAYRSHKPYVQLSMRDDWYANLGPSKQQKGVVLKTSIADTGAQCFLALLISFSLVDLSLRLGL